MLALLWSVVALAAPASGENPGVQASLSTKALQYGTSMGADWVTKRVVGVSVPDISGQIYIIFDTLYYTLTGITVAKVELPEPSVEFYQEVGGLRTSVSHLSVTLIGGWITEFGLIHDGGSFQMDISDVAVTSVVTLESILGQPIVTSVSCQASVGDVDVQFHGGASWIFQQFVNQYMDQVRGEVEDKICPQLEESIMKLDYHLMAMNVSIDVNKDMTLDLLLTGDPVVDASSLNVGLKGMIYSTKTHAEPPFEPQPFTLPEQPDYMLSLGVSEYTFNSAFYAAYSAGLLQMLVNESMIPPFSPFHLNTSSMGAFIPQLPKMYPGLLMNLQVYAREVPLVSFQPGSVNVDLQGAVKALAIQSNDTQIPLFTLYTDSKFSAKVWIADGKLKGSVQMNNLTLMLEATEVGQFQTGPLEKLARIGATMATTKLNKRLMEGVDLPRLEQAELSNTTLEVEMGFISIRSDAEISLTDPSFN